MGCGRAGVGCESGILKRNYLLIKLLEEYRGNRVRRLESRIKKIEIDGYIVLFYWKIFIQ